MTAIQSADRSTVFIEAGLVALRDEKTGDFRDPRPLFLAADRSELTPSGLLRSEKEQIDDIASVLAEKFAAYIKGVRDIQRLQEGKRI